MSRIFAVVLNLSIGVKLGITSVLAVALVSAMVWSQLHGNTTARNLDLQKTDQQTITRDAVDAKASIRGMQMGVRDIRLANAPADMQRANDYLAARLKSVQRFVDEMLKLSRSAENRARIEKMKREELPWGRFGTPEEIVESDEVRRLYLGEEFQL